jgi:hypothetical protein
MDLGDKRDPVLTHGLVSIDCNARSTNFARYFLWRVGLSLLDRALFWSRSGLRQLSIRRCSQIPQSWRPPVSVRVASRLDARFQPPNLAGSRGAGRLGLACSGNQQAPPARTAIPEHCGAIRRRVHYRCNGRGSMPLTNAELGLAGLRGFLRVGVTGLLDTTSSEATLRGFAAVPRRLIAKSPRIVWPPQRVLPVRLRGVGAPVAASLQNLGLTPGAQ